MSIHLRDIADDSLVVNNGNVGNSQSSDSLSTASKSTTSSFQDVKISFKKQEEKVFQSEKEIKEGIKQVICERITLNEFRELISNLSIIETSAFKKYLREVEYGGLFSYSKVLKALCSFDISDYTEIQSPQKKVLPKSNPIPLISDIYSSHVQKSEPGTPTKALLSSNIFSEDFHTSPQVHTPGKKAAPQKPAAPLPTLTPSPFQKSAIDTAPPSEVYNQLTRAFLAESLSGAEFLSLLTEKTSIIPSEKLIRMVEDIGKGKRVTYAELAKEITLIASKTVHIPSERPPPARSAFHTTMDIFNPSNGPDEKQEASLHSLEQNKTKRDILAWTSSSDNDEIFTPGKKIGPRNNRIATDLCTWGDGKDAQSPAPKVATPKDSLFSWSSDDGNEKRGKKFVDTPFSKSTIPWGLNEDNNPEADFNPHTHHITKKVNNNMQWNE